MSYEKIEHSEEQYEEMLNDCYGEVQICGGTYSPSHALKMVDEIAFDVGFNDWESQQPQYKCLECDTEHDDDEEAKECCEEEEEESN